MSLPLETPDAPPPPAVFHIGASPSRLGESRLLALILLLFILRDLPWRLEEPAQARQAFASLEIAQAGHWWFQHLPGGTVATVKPPLIAWVSAVAAYVTGNWDLAWRLPSLLAALGVGALLWRAGEQLWPDWGGTVAAGAFAVNFLTPRLAALVGTDMPLGLETTLLGLVVWRQVKARQPWPAVARWLVFWLLLAALMTNGPVVYALLLPGAIAHRWLSRRLGHPTADALGGWWQWILPALPFLFWLERGSVDVPGFYQQVVGHTPSTQPTQPFYYYFENLLLCWAPWSLLLLAVRTRARHVWWQVCTDPAGLWLVCWAAGGLICLTLLPEKGLGRLGPIVPPLCLLLTAALAAARHPTLESPEALWPLRWSRWTLWLAGAAAVISAAVQVSLVYRAHEDSWAEFGSRVRALTAPARCELVLTKKPDANDEAMLVYLHRLTYLDPAQAIQLNSTGQLDFIVLDANALKSARGLLTRFHAASPLLVSRGAEGWALLSSASPAARTAEGRP